MSSNSKARKLLLASARGDNWRSKLLSRREDGRELWEFIEPSTGDTKAIQITYPDGRVETSIIRHDYSKDYEG
jgi:hypothetical protein